MRIKNFLFGILALLFPLLVGSQNYWESVSSPEGVNVFDINVDSQGNIYLACPFSSNDLSGIYKSEDNAETWNYMIDGMDTLWAPHTRSIAIDNNDNLVVGGNSRIYRSNDGGEHWELVYDVSPGGYSFNTLEYGYDSIFLVGGEFSNGIVRSGDNGISWQVVLDLEELEPDCPEAITGICFGPDDVIYACSRTFYGCSGSIYRSEDLGKTWSSFYNDGVGQFYSIEFDHSNRLLVGSSGFYRYDFLVQEWSYYSFNILSKDIIVLPWNRIYIACPYTGSVSGVLLSEDNGENFEILNSGMSNPDASDFAIDIDGRILVVGSTNNSLYRSYDTVITSMLSSKLDSLSNFSVFPNPITKRSELHSHTEENVLVRIINIDGKVVDSFILEPFGCRKLNVDKFSKGLLFISISTQRFSQIKKIIYN